MFVNKRFLILILGIFLLMVFLILSGCTIPLPNIHTITFKADTSWIDTDYFIYHKILVYVDGSKVGEILTTDDEISETVLEGTHSVKVYLYNYWGDYTVDYYSRSIAVNSNITIFIHVTSDGTIYF